MFFFRLVLGLIGAVPMDAMIVGIFLLVLGFADRGAPAAGGVVGMILLVLLMIAMATVFWLVGKLTQDFVVPIMYLRRVNALEGWGILLRLLREDIGNFVLYLLFQIVLAIAIGVLVVAIILLTCCIAGCIAAIPYVGTVLMLPIFMFSRAYSAYFLAQYGPEFDVFGTEPQQPQI